MSNRYVEVFRCQLPVNYMSFTNKGKDYRNKVLNDTIDVSIVLDLKWENDFGSF